MNALYSGHKVFGSPTLGVRRFAAESFLDFGINHPKQKGIPT
jgi:hypothetical protein